MLNNDLRGYAHALVRRLQTSAIVVLALCFFAPAATAAEQLRVRLSTLIGSRDPGVAPIQGSVFSVEQLETWVAEWEPGSDNQELRELFALRELGEVVRQTALLPAAGGVASTRFEVRGVPFEIEVALSRPHEATYQADVVVRRDGVDLSAPRVTGKLGQRTTVTTRDGAEAPFLFLVIEADTAPPRLGHETDADSGPPYKVDGEEVVAPHRLGGDAPRYTAEAKAARLQGVVILEATIDEAGRVVEVRPLKELPMGLTEAAAAAVRSWRFEPALRDGQPVAVRYALTINFRLE